MNEFRLIFRNLSFYRRPYLAVLAGVMISTAVIIGALVVGDSVRFSLQQLANMRLGNTRLALQPNNRFFTRELAASVSRRSGTPVIPALLSGGIAVNSDQNLRMNQVEIIGIDKGFGTLWDRPPPMPGPDEAIVSRNVAEKLNLKPGDDLLLRIRNQGKAPPDAPFVAEKTPSVSLRVRISAIAEDDRMGRFSLKNDQAAPCNVFISLNQMADLLQIPGYANLLLAPGKENFLPGAPALDSVLRSCWRPADAGLHFVKSAREGAGDYKITTDRIFFDRSTAGAILKALPSGEPILTYLVNSIASATRSTPYSFVTACSASFLSQPVENGQIILNQWLADDLDAGPGDSVTLRYFRMGPMRSLREESSRFMVRSVIPLTSPVSDPSLMPDFPGMSNAGNCRDWETGSPVDLKKIRDKDEQYWEDYRGTPKGFISMGTGKRIWSNRFGDFTEFRFNAHEADLPGIERSVMSEINPGQYGLSFRPVHDEGQLAAANSTDFGELFLSLSFFILFSALLLTAMLFYLLAGMRMAETGILSAIGFRKRTILAILSGEAIVVTMMGAVAGVAAGILYNYFLLLGLNSIWQDAVNTSLLGMHVKPSTLFAGAAAGVITSMAALLFVAWKNLQEPLSFLVKGDVAIPGKKTGKAQGIIFASIAGISFVASFLLIGWMIFTGSTQNSSLTLVAGGLMLPGGWSLINLLLIRAPQKTCRSIPGFFRLTWKNLSLSRSRTISAVALLSLGTFTVIITGANRKTYFGADTGRTSGTGGFLLWTESTLPVVQDLNSIHGSVASGLPDEEVLSGTRYIQLPRMEGDDASCLNLNQVTRPALLGVPVGVFDRLQAFSFVKTDGSVNPNHPWNTLSSPLAPGIIPGFADQTVITWGLRKSVGDTLRYTDESGNTLGIKLMAGLENSVFQGSVLVSDSLLRLYYPSIGGSRIMLVDGEASRQDTIARRLEYIFRDYGMVATPAPERLASFNAVENTYLSVFMLLGGLGTIIGTIGLGIVLLRNIARRRAELSLYAALGFRKEFVFKLVLAEHLMILASGVLLGLIASLPALLPLMNTHADTSPMLMVSGILLMIFVNGFLWIYFPARKILAGEPLSGLRTE